MKPLVGIILENEQVVTTEKAMREAGIGLSRTCIPNKELSSTFAGLMR